MELAVAREHREIPHVRHQRRGPLHALEGRPEGARDGSFDHAFLRADPHPSAERLAQVLRLHRRRACERAVEQRPFARACRFGREGVRQACHRVEAEALPRLCPIESTHEECEGLRELSRLARAGDDDLAVVSRDPARDVEEQRSADAEGAPIAHGKQPTRGEARCGGQREVVRVRRDGREGLRESLLLADARAASSREVEGCGEALHDAPRSSTGPSSRAPASRPMPRSRCTKGRASPRVAVTRLAPVARTSATSPS